MGPQSYEKFKWKASYNTRKGSPFKTMLIPYIVHLKKEERIKEKWLFGSLILFFDDFDLDAWEVGSWILTVSTYGFLDVRELEGPISFFFILTLYDDMYVLVGWLGGTRPVHDLDGNFL
ncbi:hypothetical protein RIR_jg27681.t1 [Rhizophagus irregularis DAOM 181602=DAOM 197198]|nr:hypothetical protein RIR_jg27681.t1 [Rhizophagus irregularis DAOM 181602=DAOM 197198]